MRDRIGKVPHWAALLLVVPAALGALAVQAAEPQGTLRIGVLTDVTDFDAWNIRTGNFSVLPQLYDSLFVYGEDRSFVPQLATGYTFNADNSAITVTLREGAVFHSGAPVDAEAVAAMLTRAKDPAKPIGELGAIDSWSVLGPQEIQFTFKSPLRVGLVQDMLAYFPIPDPASASGFDWTKTDAGSGPYMLAERVPGERIVLKAAPDYWDEETPRAAELVYTIFGDGSAANTALETGLIDVLYNASANSARRLGDQGFGVLNGPGPFMLGLFVSPFEPPFDNQTVRQALMHIIPREAVSRTVFFGQSKPTATVFVPGSPGYSENYNTRYGYDPAKAKAMLESTGLSNAELSDFKILVPSNRPYNQGLAEIVQAELGKIGINVEIDLRDTAEAGAMIVSGQFEVTSTNLSRTHKDPASIVSSSALQTTKNSVLHDAVFPDYVEAIERLTKAVEPAEVDAATENLREVLAERAWIIPCCTSPQGITLFRQGLQGVGVTVDNMLNVRSVSVE